MINVFKILAILLFLVGCGGESYGKVHFDREPCKHCQMIISDNKFSVDVVFNGKNLYFDDIGCFVSYAVKQNPELISKAKIYVNDYESGEFIEAKTAYFYHGYGSPMMFGYAAFKQPLNGKEALNFDELIKHLKNSKAHH